MVRKALADDVTRLSRELDSDEPLSREDRDRLAQVLSDLAQLVDEEQDDPTFGDAVDEELRELSVRLEQARPSLSILVGRIVDSLSQLGI